MKKAIAVASLAASAMLAQHYSNAGELALPDYRKWVYLGSGVGMSYTETSRENPPFTNVFAEPAAYDKFMKTGTWPDKTVLIAEMRESATNVSINKSGRVQTAKVLAVEAEVKDTTKGGWAFYGFKNGAQTGTLFPKSAACYSCHEEHASTDNTFVQFYPTLIETSKQHGTYKER
jgi:Cytochrome P460